MDYYCARLFLIVLVDDGKAKKRNLYTESILVFKAKSYDDAFQRALRLGEEQETVYKNSVGKDGQEVRWALVEVAEIRCVGKKIDGVEVISKMVDRTSKTPISFDTDFKPAAQQPDET